MKPENSPAASASSTPSRWTGVRRRIKRVFYWIGFFVIIILGVFFYWKFFYTYSEGFRAGYLQKFSRKGTIFKTYEGELILSSVTGRSDVVIASEKFYFSVKNEALADRLDTLQGRNVILHYEQKNAALIWKGDTPYYVDSVSVR
jgi:hypothetical protein